MKLKRPERAFILRQSPSGISQLQTISLPNNLIVNGWSAAKGLIEETDRWKFREIIRKACYPREKSLRKAGYGASTMQRFINSMQNGDWVVVPHSGSKFYIAEVASSAYYDDSKQARETDSCYRRKVRWLNGKKPLEKKLAKARLVARMKTQQTSAEASDLIDEIYDVMRHASRQVSADERLGSTLRQDFKAAVRKRIAELITPQRLELLVKRVLEANGATVRRIGTRSDKGVDLIATFEVGRVTQLEIGVQVKHHNGLTENKWIDQLKKGLEEEDLAYGWLVTTGEFAADAPDYREKKLQGTGLRIDQVDGGALADLIVDSGVDTLG